MLYASISSHITTKLPDFHLEVLHLTLSGRLDSNQRPPTPEAGALTGLRYTPNFSWRKYTTFFNYTIILEDFFDFYRREAPKKLPKSDYAAHYRH